MKKKKKKIAFKTINTKLLVSFSFILALVIAYSLYNLSNNIKVKDDTNELINTQLELQIANQESATSFAVQLGAVRGYILSGQETYLDMLEEYHDLLIKQQETIHSLSSNSLSAELNNKTDQWYEDIQTDVIAVAKSDDRTKAAVNLTKLDELSTEIRMGYESLAQERSKIISEKGNDLVEQTKFVQTMSIIIPILLVIYGVLVAYFISRSIAKPLKNIVSRLKKVSEGDLTDQPEEITSRDEVAQLAEMTNLLSQQLRNMLTNIQSVSTNVAHQSSNLAQSSDEIQQGAAQISLTMQELADGTEEQASHASDLSSTTENFVTGIRTASEKGSAVFESANNVLDLTKNGSNLMLQSTEQMNSIDRIMNDAVQNMTQLNKESEQISTLIQVIDSIANQTNLLALNAAIEAARAGEAGKGFAVVADEVKKLAEQVSTSVIDISTIVQKIQSNTALVSTSLENGYGEVLKGTEQLQTTNTTFENIRLAVTQMASDVQIISNDLSAIESSSQTIQIAVDEIASVSEESAAGVEETTATVQQTSSSMEEISKNADDLSVMAKELNNTVNKFKL